MRVLRMFHCLTCGSRVSPSSGTCRGASFVLCLGGFFVCFVCGLCCLFWFPSFASARVFCLTVLPRVVVLDDRQCFTARSATR